ncbi:MAG: ATP-binding protein [Defluviitaleaceae bacterium]|nr:ATP-binding protein [Defluviitaleaceae bacterium]
MTINELGVTYRELFNSIPVACICFDAENEPLDCNALLVGLVGAPSRTGALAYFRGDELKHHLTELTDEFVYISERGDSDEKIILKMRPKALKDGITIVHAEELNLDDARGRLMLDSAPMAISFFDVNANIVDCNLEAVKMFGFAEKSDYLEHFMRLMPPIQPNGRSSKKLIREYMNEALETGYAKNEFVRQKIDGSLMQTEASFLRAEHEGEPVIIGYSRDLTDIYAAEERAREANEMAQIYMDNSPIGMEIWDELHQLVDCNQRVYEMFGFADKNSFLSYAKEEQLCDKDNHPHVQTTYLQHALEQGSSRYEWTYTRPDKKSLPCEIFLVRVLRDFVPQVMVFFFDVTRLEKALEASREANRRSQLMLDRTPLACFLVREDLTAIDCNQSAVELFGFANKVDALLRYREIFPTDKLPKTLDWIGISAPTCFEYEHKSVATDEIIPCEVTMIHLNYLGKPVIAHFMNDLRERHALQADLKRKELAEEESRAKSQFLARMSHEIRTPLNSIMGIADIHLHGREHLPETEEAFLQIRSSSQILLGIINDILDLSKVEAGKMKIVSTPYEIASIIFDTVQLNLMYIGSKPINFSLLVEENIPQILVGDELRIKQVLNNLLSNAFKYTREGDVTLSFSVENASDDKLTLVIKLQDTGQGMTQDQIASLFEREYVRFNESENRMIEGTGLGMNITNRMIEMMSGEISAESEVGVGSTFYVRLPQKAGGKQTLGPEIVENLQNFKLSQRSFHKRHTFNHEHMPYGKVLIVDDVESNLFVAKGLMMPYGLSVETASSGFETIHKIKEEGKVYDIIFMDHMMPDLDGIETAKRLREIGYEEPIVALTANTIIGQAELFMSNGFAGFISKPIDMMRLNGYLMSLIRDKQPPEVIEAAQAAAPAKVDLSGALVDSFLRDAERAIIAIDSLLETEEWGDEEYKLYTINTHGLKSALANVGKTQLSGTAGSLEQAGRDKSAGFIREKTLAFIDELRFVVFELSPKESDALRAESDNTRLLHEGLRKVRALCADFKKKPVRIALDSLNTQAWTPETRAFLSELSGYLLHTEFEKISEEIEKFLK